MPQFSQEHVDVRLTNYSQKYQNNELVGEKLFPPIPVKKESDKYIIYGLENFNLHDTLRANGAEASQIDWSFSDGNYFCEEHSLRGIVTDRDKSNADKPLTVEVDTLEIVTDTVMLDKENDSAQLARDTSNYTLGNTSALSGTDQWSDYTNSDPLEDMKTMQVGVYTISRKYTNTLLLPFQVALTLAYHPKILELVKYTDSGLLQTLSGGIADGLLPKRLFGMNVVIAGAAVNTSNPGQDATLSDLSEVWGNDVIAAYVNPTVGLKTLSFGKTFRTEKYVRKWREESRHGDWVEFNDIYDQKLTAAACGYLLQTVIA